MKDESNAWLTAAGGALKLDNSSRGNVQDSHLELEVHNDIPLSPSFDHGSLEDNPNFSTISIQSPNSLDLKKLPKTNFSSKIVYPSQCVDRRLSLSNDHYFLSQAAWPFCAALTKHGLMQGTGCSEASEEGPSPQKYFSLPGTLRPTPLQLVTPHKRWIDRLPFPRLRDSLILLCTTEDLDDFVKDIFSPIGYISLAAKSYPTWDAKAWVIAPEFALKWSYLFG